MKEAAGLLKRPEAAPDQLTWWGAGTSDPHTCAPWSALAGKVFGGAGAGCVRIAAPPRAW